MGATGGRGELRGDLLETKRVRQEPGRPASQIGYMMLGAGLGPAGYALAIFHLLTHGFFKVQLFLGAGSVMHAMGDQVDMRRFGALAGAMRITWATMGIGWLAILGVSP